MTPTLRTERLLLEPYAPEDEEEFVALFQDTDVSRWMGDGPSTEAEDRALFGRVFTKVYAQDLFAVWAVRRDGELVGHAEIKRTEAVDGHEIIYALARHGASAWGPSWRGRSSTTGSARSASLRSTPPSPPRTRRR